MFPIWVGGIIWWLANYTKCTKFDCCGGDLPQKMQGDVWAPAHHCLQLETREQGQQGNGDNPVISLLSQSIIYRDGTNLLMPSLTALTAWSNSWRR